MRKRVLVADDEPMTADMLALMFTFRGFEVIKAYDGREALERARELHPDVVLLDVDMPRVGGPGVARSLRDDPELRDATVVLFSCMDEQDVDWQSAGADLFLQKPLDLRELPDLVDRISAEHELSAHS